MFVTSSDLPSALVEVGLRMPKVDIRRKILFIKDLLPLPVVSIEL
jgi:hypothetical protein